MSMNTVAKPETPSLRLIGSPRVAFDTAAAAANCPIPAPRSRECVAITTRNATLMLDAGGSIRWASLSACQLLGHADSRLQGRPITAVLPDLPMRAATRGYNVAFATLHRGGAPLPMRAVDARGRPRSWFVTFDAMREDDRTTLIVGLSQACLPASPQSDLDRYVGAVARKFDAIAITDSSGLLQHVNDAYEQLTGLRRADVLGRHVFCYSGGRRGAAEFANLCVELDQGREVRATYAATKGDGAPWHAEESARPFVDAYGDVSHYVFTLRDATARVADVARLQHLAHHDALTGLPNRLLFTDRLQQALAHALRRGTGFAVLCIDIDRFKAANDTFGHAAGDRLLRALGASLRSVVREGDTVARLGGDEFAVILDGTSRRADVATVVEAIRARCAEALREEAGTGTTLSIGAARFPFDAAEATGLLHAADLAMYRAKRAGGDRHCFACDEPATA